jgi:hypothetical protein
MLKRFRRDEGGFVLVVVVLSLVFLLMLVTSVLDYSIGSQNISRRDQDWNAALSAAEAGIDDYIFHLNQDGSYWQYSDTNPPPDGNEAFTDWVTVPGPANDAFYRYDVDIANIAVDGTVTVTSTGMVRDVTRSVRASVRRKNFLDYLYFTDYETTDPPLYPTGSSNFTPAQAQTLCAMHYYEGRDISGRVDYAGDSDSSGQFCNEITFATIDVINGPLHSNDAIQMSGSPDFNGDVTTSWDGDGGPRYWGGGTPSFSNAGDPAYADPLTMPPSNVELKQEAQSAFGGTGCLFTGPTAIKLNSDGTMDVISPFSRDINCSVTMNPNTNLYYTEAGSAGFRITRMAQPANGIIYVQSVPSTASDPNFTSGCPAAMTRPRIGNTTSTIAHPLGFPQANDITPASWYGCRAGDVFLQGVLNGRLTIAADNNITLFGSTTYAGGAGGDDLLGLVANNYVEVYHPARNDGSTTNCDGGLQGGSTNPNSCNLRIPGTSTSATVPSLFSGAAPGTSVMAQVLSARALRNPQFYGPILTVQHSFRVPNQRYGVGSILGTLTVVGAIAQRYRGFVGFGSGTAGYAKNYSYDQRLKYDSPPKFLNPVASAWQVVTWSECTTSTCAPDAT